MDIIEKEYKRLVKTNHKKFSEAEIKFDQDSIMFGGTPSNKIIITEARYEGEGSEVAV
jgi:hypothetical protein